MKTRIKPLLYCIFILLLPTVVTTIVQAQSNDDKKGPTVIWINSWYGANHSGIGLAGRYSIIGIGATVFGFKGDSAVKAPTALRPGQIGINADAYYFADFSNWIALYLNVGVVARLDTFRTNSIAGNYETHEAASTGGGFQISLASHLMLGIGYNFIWDSQASPRYSPIHSLVAQVGYRL